MNLNDVEWIETEPLYVTLISAESSRYLVRDAGARYALMVSYEEASGYPEGARVLLFNGEFVDVGEQLMAYLGALDAATEEGTEVYVEAE
jgi:hypothetical protein